MRAAVSSLCLIFAVAPLVRAEEIATPAAVSPAATSPVRVATDDAIQRLLQDVRSTAITDRVDTGMLIDAVDGQQELLHALQRARQIGGPRYVTDDLVQVRLEVPGPRVAETVLRCATVKSDRSPIPPERLTTLLDTWRRRTFSATGSSLPTNVDAFRQPTTDTVDVMRPVEVGVAAAPPTTMPAPIVIESMPDWVGGSFDGEAVAGDVGGKLRTARKAERDARQQLYTQLGSVPLTNTVTISQAIEQDPRLGARIAHAVDSARVVGVDYRDDDSVRVRLQLDGRTLWDAIIGSR